MQLQHINLKSKQLASFRNFPVDRVKEIGTEEGVMASSARNWGPASGKTLGQKMLEQ